MTAERAVVVVANDVVPGCGLPVAGPGLRADGLATGLRAHGFRVDVAVPRPIVEKRWRSTCPPATPPGVYAIRPTELGKFVAMHAPATVILTNSNNIRWMDPHAPGIRYVVDFFAPKMLELESGDFEPSPRAVSALREQKLQAIRLAHGLLINGAKKVEYYREWVVQAARDPDDLPTRVVNMPVPVLAPRAPRRRGPVRAVIAGYMQPWSKPGPWLAAVARVLTDRAPALTVDLVLPSHWGGGGTGMPTENSEELKRLLRHPGVRRTGLMRITDFRRFLSTADVAIDMFERSPEREHAMVTRTVVALASGLPVIHPPFTEVSPFIERWDAGWLIDPDDRAGLAKLLSSIIDDPGQLALKSANATRLALEVFDPSVAVRPLVDLLRSGDLA